MLRFLSLGLGVGGGHFYMGLTLWQTIKRLYQGDFQFTLIHSTGIDCPVEDPTLDFISMSLEPELLFTYPKQTMLYEYIMHLDPDVLFVDSIWFPIVPYLKKIRAKKISFSVYMPPLWFQPHPLDLEGRYSFCAGNYDLAFTIEPGFSLDGCLSLPPVINIHESLIQPPEVIRSVLHVPDGKKLALVAHSGEEGEIEQILKQADVDPDEYCLRSVASGDENSNRLFPLAHYLSGVDFAIGGGGYGFLYETLYYGIPSIYLPQPRIGNEQHWRLEHCLDYDGPYDGADQMVQRIMELF